MKKQIINYRIVTLIILMSFIPLLAMSQTVTKGSN